MAQGPLGDFAVVPGVTLQILQRQFNLPPGCRFNAGRQAGQTVLF